MDKIEIKMKNIYDKSIVEALKSRIENIAPESKPQWGKMSADQMFAHVNVPYDLAFNPTKPPLTGFKQFLMRKLIKNVVVGEKPYKKNGRTAPEFLITDKRDFAAEKKMLFENLDKTAQLGAQHFEGKMSQSFGPLKASEWNNMFYKHLDHHLSQFGV